MMNLHQLALKYLEDIRDAQTEEELENVIKGHSEVALALGIEEDRVKRVANHARALFRDMKKEREYNHLWCNPEVLN